MQHLVYGGIVFVPRLRTAVTVLLVASRLCTHFHVLCVFLTTWGRRVSRHLPFDQSIREGALLSPGPVLRTLGGAGRADGADIWWAVGGFNALHPCSLLTRVSCAQTGSRQRSSHRNPDSHCPFGFWPVKKIKKTKTAQPCSPRLPSPSLRTCVRALGPLST